MRPRSRAELWIGLLLTLLFTPALADPLPAPTSTALTQLEAADHQFRDKSYAVALEGYRQVLASGVELGERRPEVEYGGSRT